MKIKMLLKVQTSGHVMPTSLETAEEKICRSLWDVIISGLHAGLHHFMAKASCDGEK